MHLTRRATPHRRVLLAFCLVVLALVAISAPAPAAARSEASPCWKKLINDWYDGRIDNSYQVHCYRDALKHLPQDVRTYSDAYEVISRALASATRGKKNPDPDTLIPPPSDGGSGGGSGTGGGGGPGGTGTTKTGDGDPSAGGGFLTTATDKLGSDSADTIPVPLLVLAGLALLLVAAGGAGLLARRLQGRRGSP